MLNLILIVMNSNEQWVHSATEVLNSLEQYAQSIAGCTVQLSYAQTILHIAGIVYQKNINKIYFKQYSHKIIY